MEKSYGLPYGYELITQNTFQNKARFTIFGQFHNGGSKKTNANPNPTKNLNTSPNPVPNPPKQLNLPNNLSLTLTLSNTLTLSQTLIDIASFDSVHLVTLLLCLKNYKETELSRQMGLLREIRSLLLEAYIL